ncbi:MAG: hypothetical protein IJK20_02230 [Bacteroidales bacterium]|nr:hypothetical protein [Bacteroidales bacterium]
MNLPTLIVLIAVAVAFIAVVCVIIRRRNRCATGCGNCPFAEGCQRKRTENEQ